MESIEKIEIIRGGSSVRYGNNALGGVVNVITKKPTETPTLTLLGTYGGGDIDAIQNYRLTHTYKIGPLGYSLAGSYQKADPFLLHAAVRKRVELDPYVTADISLKIPLGKHMTFSCYVENMVDEEYEEQFGYPMPGIVVGAALKLYL